jgi:hypothetical protein
VDGDARSVHEKIEANPRLLTCGYGVVFGRLEFVAKQKVGKKGMRLVHLLGLVGWLVG